MAILENRVKHASHISELVKFCIVLAKRFSVIFLIACSVYLLRTPNTMMPAQVSIGAKLSTTALELSGNLLSGAVAFYDVIAMSTESVQSQMHYFKNLEAENIALKLELAKLRSKQAYLESLEAENNSLKKLLKVVATENNSFTTAKLLSISLSPFSQTAIIGAGSDHGVAVDQVVVSNEGLVGRVVETSTNYAKIMLVSDTNSRIPVVAVSSRERGVMVGDNHSARMLYIQDKETLKTGELLLTSGDGKVYPAGIAVGTVTQISEDDVIVKPVTDLRGVNFVQIYTNSSAISSQKDKQQLELENNPSYFLQ